MTATSYRRGTEPPDGSNRGSTPEPSGELDSPAQFERAWVDPRHWSFELPPVDLNRVLGEHYQTAVPLTLTRAMLWDIEVRKARRPDYYIPSVVAENTATAWAPRTITRSVEFFVRASQQRLWLTPAQYGLILEQVWVDSSAQTVTFIGVPELTSTHGTRLHTDTRQPLFHVQHWVDGAEQRPLSRWRVVHLTNTAHEALTERFTALRHGWLPEFVEIYIRDLDIDLSRR